MSKKITMIFGWVFLVLGVLGFFSNPLVGANGFLMTDMVHNLVHLLSGVIFLWVAYSAADKAGTVLKVLGVVYLVIAILGFLSSGMILGFIMTNSADNWLHVVLGLIFVWAGFSSKGSMQSMPMGQQM